MKITELEFHGGSGFETAVTVTSAEAAPTTVAHGYDCWGYKRVLVVVHTLTAITDWSGQLYVYGDDEWVLANGGNFDNMGNNTFAEWFDIEGFTRVQFVIDAQTGTSQKRALKIM